MNTVNKPLILDIGSAEGTVTINASWEDATVVRLDINPDANPDFIHDITEPFPEELRDKFDLAVLSHVLEHMNYRNVKKVLKNCMQCLKPGTGELWVVVPALEWAAKEIAKDEPSPALMGFLYGSQTDEWQYHKCGFTLNLLRLLVEDAGMYARQAFQSTFAIRQTHPDESYKDFSATQNIVVGLRSE